MDYFWNFVKDVKETPDGIFVVQSIIGNIYCGAIPIDKNSITAVAIDVQPNLLPDCEMFWKLESMGINDPPPQSIDDEIAKRKFHESVVYKSDRYFVSWPFKSNMKFLPTNAGLALGRLQSTLKKLLQNPDLLEQYLAIIQDQLKRGVIEIAPIEPQGDIVHYLSHHAVVTPQKATTKVRMVFDASAKLSKDAPSLNDCIYRGPIDLPEIPGLLFRLRKPKIIVTGDIEKAFHQIFLHEPDRDAVRFFWVKDPSKPIEKENLIIYRFLGITFGVIASPSMLNEVIKLHLKKQNDADLLKILPETYVDNIHFMVETSEDGIQMYEKVRKSFLDASMNVREWLSNDPMIQKAIPIELQQKSTESKLLGLLWDSKNDTLSIELKNKMPKGKWTKRTVLQFVASTYDPLGFLSPITIQGRIFVQKLFQASLSWDEFLPIEYENQWILLVSNWNGNIVIPRRYFQTAFPASDQIELHAFADASQLAYCATVYIRIPTDRGFDTTLVFAKTRLQPCNKKLTIPKMEVMGIWLAAKIITYVAKEMKLDLSPKFIWTDSQIATYWFKKWPKDVFVSNRLKEVLSSNADCLFVPGKLNPADLGTRGISLDELRESKQWWNGPQFLSKPKEDWPRNPAGDPIQTLSLAADLTQTIVALVALAGPVSTLIMQNIEPDREYAIDENLTWMELKLQVLCKLKQMSYPPEQEIYVSNKQMKEFKLSPNDHEILILNCRFDHAELINPNPIWIPKQSPIVQLLVMDAHESLHHAGVPHTLSKLREKFWISSGRAIVKKWINTCSSCKLWKGKPFALPKMPQLPGTRINRSKPFDNVGVDYCGPFKIKGKEEKVWVILFTCFTTRLIHLEPVTTMTTEDFLLSFRRFVARRGTPKYVLSDNAKQFKTAATALDQIWSASINDEQTTNFCLQHDITWDYITERAPWKGGLYERLVGLVKNAMKQSIGKKFLSLNEYSTFLCEIEATLNSRPITYVHANDPIVIRPTDFISPSIELTLPTSDADSFSTDPSYLPSNAAGGEPLEYRIFEYAS
uniref:Integrase catalytic domain-containing protein n=1 Tax=Panagrolaimus superbus TaxID=310955 RepID=A0A914YCB1_9BILA